jgi:putative ABC transport system substrate-binding protein
VDSLEANHKLPAPATAAVFAETRTTPIVFANASDPIGSGFAVSLAHPDGNVTGFTNFEATIGQKWLELLKEIAPHIRRVRVIFNPETAVNGGRYFFEPIEMAARKQQIEAVALPVRSAGEIEHAITATAELSDVGLISIPDVFLTPHRDLIVSLTVRHRIPGLLHSPPMFEQVVSSPTIPTDWTKRGARRLTSTAF